jgi:hypothetical protein
MEYHITPELIVPVLKNADLVSTKDGSHRKLVIKGGKELIPNRMEVSQSPFTPTIVFGGLLLLTLFITFVEWRCNCKRAAQVLDIVLFTMQSLCGFLLVYITFVSDIFGVNWNWYLIPFNPFPLVLWICLRKQRNYGRIYLLYMVVLLVFMALTPLISQIDWTHQFITASFLIRIIANYYKYKKYK